MTDLIPMMSFFFKQWFLLALIMVMGLSWLTPKLFHDLHWLSYLKFAFIASIFLCSGLGLRITEMKSGLSHWRLHGLIQFFSLVLTPIFCLGLALCSQLIGMDPALRIGLIVLGAVPTTITSCVVLTTAAKGNQAGALVNATLGNLLGVIITPMWIFFLVGVKASLPIHQIMIKLGLLVLLPLIFGQILQRPFKAFITSQVRKRIGKSTLFFLLGIVWISFHQSFAEEFKLTYLDFILCLAICLLLHPVLLLSAWYLSKSSLLSFALPDRVCVLICCSQKTLALGLPVIALCFTGDPRIPLISLPLLIYHPIQLLTAGAMAPRLAKFIEKASSSSEPDASII